MSYDLYFCREKGKPLSFDEVAQWATRFPQFKRSTKTQLWYENPSTGVYFSVEHDEADTEDHVIPAGFEEIHLVFNMNFIRPGFFAYEAMPIVGELVRHFDLSVVDDWEDPPRRMTAEQLIASWLDNEDRAVPAIRDDPDFHDLAHMPRAKGLRFWRYMREREGIEDRLVEDIFVPSYLLFRVKGGLEVKLGISWLTSIPMIVPPADLFILGFERLIGKGLRRVVCGGGAVLSMVGAYLEDFDPALGLKVLPEKNVKPAAKLLKNVEPRWTMDDLTRIAPGGFVDSETVR